jgi:DNA-binding NarL/FixJ family response regulator
MSAGSPYRIVLADDHTLVRQGIKAILQRRCDLEVVGEACDGLDLLNLLEMSKLNPHMVILDISMPNISGLEATHRIKEMYPEIKVLILTMHRNKEYIDYAFKAGADGYILKEDADKVLFSAIERVMGGDNYISPILDGGV